MLEHSVQYIVRAGVAICYVVRSTWGFGAVAAVQTAWGFKAVVGDPLGLRGYGRDVLPRLGLRSHRRKVPLLELLSKRQTWALRPPIYL